MNERPATEVVLAVGTIPWEGNVTPLPWYKHLRREPDKRDLRRGKPGKPHTNAITILADLVYWYRPVEIRDTRTNRIVGYRRKFEGEIFQRNYGDWEEMFGLTDDQAKDAIDFLAEKGVVVVTINDVELGDGRTARNRVFLELVPDRLREITEVDDPARGVGFNPGRVWGLNRGIRKIHVRMIRTDRRRARMRPRALLGPRSTPTILESIRFSKTTGPGSAARRTRRTGRRCGFGSPSTRWR